MSNLIAEHTQLVTRFHEYFLRVLSLFQDPQIVHIIISTHVTPHYTTTNFIHHNIFTIKLLTIVHLHSAFLLSDPEEKSVHLPAGTPGSYPYQEPPVKHL